MRDYVEMNPRGIVLVGLYYSGKTSTAKFIGLRSRFDVYDLDEIYKEKYGESIFLTRDREENIADQQRDCIGCDIMEKMTKSPSIAVFGGGSFLRVDEERVERIKESHVIVYLSPTVEALTTRVLDEEEDTEFRFVFRHKDPVSIGRYFENKYRQYGSDFLKWCDAIVQPECNWNEDRVGLEVLSRYLTEMSSRFRRASEHEIEPKQ